MFKKKTVLNPPAPGTKTFEFRLGDEVEDKLNGLKGIAVTRAYHLTGCDTFVVELPAADGKPGESFSANGDRLKLVTPHPDRHIDEIPDDDVCLGDQVKDVTTGMTGIVTLLAIPLYGTTRACIEPGYIAKDKKVGEGWMVDTNVIEVIRPLKEPAPAPAAATTSTEPAPKPKRDGACRLPRNF